jgi:maltose alpha-D-glucosyltransferase/alpha-amylase
MAAKNNSNPLWYKDGIIYQVHIKSFRDSNNDGIGDIKGLTEKLDYVHSLGINILWILPFYPSPMKDDGYDISDYFNIHPDYGTLDDFKEFLREAHKRKIRVITELVMNHTSDQHEWFKRARKSPPGSPERNFYVWSEDGLEYEEARIIFNDFETSNWTWDSAANAYYWHRFYSHQPDLNFNNPEVHKAIFRAVDFWFDMGVDGMRLDAVPYLYEREGTNCENLPETHEFLKKLNVHIKEKYPDKIFLAEANQWPEDAVAYFGNGDECHMAFHFPLMPRMYMAVQMETRYPIIDILEQTPEIPANCQWAMFLRNHDELTLEMVTDEERDYMYRYYAKDKHARLNLGIRRRLAPLVENNRRKIKLLNILLFSFPGTPIIYYGDEIGMGDNYYLGDRNGVRTPMQWSPDRNAGFSRANPQQLYLPVIIDPEYHFESVNVEVQERIPSSLLTWMKRAVAVRKKYRAFGRGDIRFLSPSNSKVLAFLRTYENETILVVTNLSRFSEVVELNLAEYIGSTPVELFSRNKFPEIKDSYYMLTMNAYDYYWFQLVPVEETERSADLYEPPELEPLLGEFSFFGYDDESVLNTVAIPDFLKRRQWFGIEDQKIDAINVYDEIPLSTGDEYTSLVLLQINYVDDTSVGLIIPCSAVFYNREKLKESDNLNSVIAYLDKPGKILYESRNESSFRDSVIAAILNSDTLKGKRGDMLIEKEEKFYEQTKAYLDAKISNSDDSNQKFIDLNYGGGFKVRLYRKIVEEGHPGIEMFKALSLKSSFNNIPEFLGTIYYKSFEGNLFVIGFIEKEIPNEGNFWKYLTDVSISHYEKRINLQKEHIEEFNTENKNLLNGNTKDFYISSPCDELESMNLDLMELLGKRTGELHSTLTSIPIDGFEPDKFDSFYQRSLYQSNRSLTRNTFRVMRNFTGPEKVKMEEIFDREELILEYLKTLLEEKFDAKKIRIHGDLNLKRVLITGKDFIFINFEGQPAIASSAKRLKRSPFRDIAGMIGSIYFAAHTSLQKFGLTFSEDVSAYNAFANRWWFCMSNKFLRGYLSTAGQSGFLPKNENHISYLVNVYMIEKMLTEIAKGIFRNAKWLKIPVEGLRVVTNLIKQ